MHYRKVAPYGSIKIMDDKTDEYIATNLMRYAWVFELYIHFYPLDVSRPAEYFGKIVTILEKLKDPKDPNCDMNRILDRTTDYLKLVLAVKPLKSEDVISDKEYNDFLMKLKNEPVPVLTNDNKLRPATIVPRGFENSMRSVVSIIVEGCIFATAKIEIFCTLQKAVSRKTNQLCKFKGFEMVYEILDRRYLK